MIRCIAFDCFGTVFDMSAVSRDEIREYVQHVRRGNFTPFAFPASWLQLPSHPDASEGIRRLRAGGYECVTLSNGSAELLTRVSEANAIAWDHIVDLVAHRAYKPNNANAYRAVEIDTGITAAETMMVTANPEFGDVEASAAIGMTPQVIRHPGHPATIIDLAEQLGC